MMSCEAAYEFGLNGVMGNAATATANWALGIGHWEKLHQRMFNDMAMIDE